jgi:hypothetical protein
MLDKLLLRIAKTAILAQFDSKYKIDRDSLISQYPYLAQIGASFVTLHYDKQLRGCIGSIIGRRTLLDDILGNALSSAFKDSRFSPLHVSEISQLDLEVSLLSTPEILEYKDFDDLVNKIEPFTDGLILHHGNYQGTFLPQVWKQLPSAHQFLEHLSYKAGADLSIYDEHPTIYRYRVDAIEERFDAILPL